MTNQAIDNIGKNILYYHTSNIVDFDVNKKYLLRLEKEGCKSRTFRADVEVCGCRASFIFYINNCLDELGLWTLEIKKDEDLIDDRIIYFRTTVEVYKAQ